jgi:hypothetical protein
MVTTKKPSKFFNNEEISKLMPYISGNMKFDYNVAKGLATELSRTTNSVHKYVRNQKAIYKELGRVKRRYTKRVNNDAKVTADKSVVKAANIIKHGEFVIPINSFELRTDNGITSLVLKFDK